METDVLRCVKKFCKNLKMFKLIERIKSVEKLKEKSVGKFKTSADVKDSTHHFN